MSEPPDFNGFSSMHLIADLYRNFNYPAVIAGMFVIGIAFRFFYLFCAPSRSNPPGVFLYAALFPDFVHAFETDLGSSAVNVVRSILLIVVTAYFLGIRFRRLRSKPQPHGTYTPVIAANSILQTKESF
jgi:hypothetical protein